MSGLLGLWFAKLIWYLIENYTSVSEDTKAFLLKLPTGFWTLLSGLVTALVAMVTLLVTQVMNKLSQNTQLEHQEQIQDKQLSHQREIVYMQYFLDKRTSAILEFQNRLEDAKGILVYFKSEHADLARRKALGVEYQSTVIHTKNFIKMDVYSTTQVENFIEVSLAQIEPMHEKLNELKKSFNIMSIYLEDNETGIVYDLVNKIESVQDYIVGVLKGIESRDDKKIYTFIHADDPLYGLLKQINTKHVATREVLKKYLYVNKLNA